MAKCLVTKLNGSVDNNELIRVGEMRIKVESVESPSADKLGFGMSFTEPTVVEIVGDGYFTDRTLNENKGKSMVVSSNGDLQAIIVSQPTTVAIRNKYKLGAITVFFPNSVPYGKNKVINIDDLKYSYSLSTINLSNMQVSGDIASLKNLTSLRTLNLSLTSSSGDIANLKNLTALADLNITSTKISGDIANLKNLTALTNLSFQGSSVSGDLSNVYFAYTTKQIITIAQCNNLSGDLANVPDNILYINSDKGNSKFTWKKGSTRTNILACTHLCCDNIDDMLNDMASMTASFVGQESFYKKISLVGTRTSASDDAVQTLQSKGYTISVSPA